MKSRKLYNTAQGSFWGCMTAVLSTSTQNIEWEPRARPWNFYIFTFSSLKPIFSVVPLTMKIAAWVENAEPNPACCEFRGTCGCRSGGGGEGSDDDTTIVFAIPLTRQKSFKKAQHCKKAATSSWRCASSSGTYLVLIILGNLCLMLAWCLALYFHLFNSLSSPSFLSTGSEQSQQSLRWTFFTDTMTHIQ